jgi:transposase
MSPKQYRPHWLNQPYLFPPSAEEWLDPDHLVYFIRDVLAGLDITAIVKAIQAKDPRGERPYDPLVMLGIILFGYCCGIYSSRKLERATQEQVAFRIIAGDSRPHFTTINTFRKTHREAIAGFFLQVLRLCQEAGLVRLGHVAVDGTKIKADASKHKAKSYERFQAEEEALKEQIARLLDRSDAADAEEDAQFGEGQREFELPELLRQKEGRLEKIRQIRATMEQKARQARAELLREQADAQRAKAEETQDPAEHARKLTRAQKSEEKADQLDPHDDDDQNEPPPASPTDLPRRQMPSTPDGAPDPKAQMSPTDPDSHLMKGSDGGFQQSYNAQAAVDDTFQVITAADVTDQPPDSHNLLPMLHQTRDNCGDAPVAVTADAGFWNNQVADQAATLGTKALVALSRESKKRQPSPPPETTAARQKMAEALAQPDNRKLYRKRKTTVEPVFGQIKETRGFRQFSFRGIEAVRAEWRIVALCHNLLKLFTYRNAPQPA